MVYVGFSGGQDSCALAHYLKYEKGEEVILIHFDHKWPEDKGLVDKCKELALYMNIELVILEGNESTNESEARHARYSAISNYTNEVYIGHTLTDKVETGLYNLVRNPSMKGIASLSYPKRYLDTYSLTIYRPLLDWTRDDTQKYCEKYGIEYHTDAYNSKEETSRRVIIRDKVVPNLKRINVGAEEHISEFIEEVKETNSFVSKYVDKMWNLIYKEEINGLDKELLLGEGILIQKHIWIRYLSINNMRLRRKTINYLVDWSGGTKSNNIDKGRCIVLKGGMYTCQ
jgi:tRNA(Ile)-lysidine synthase